MVQNTNFCVISFVLAVNVETQNFKAIHSNNLLPVGFYFAIPGRQSHATGHLLHELYQDKTSTDFTTMYSKRKGKKLQLMIVYIPK